MAKKMVSLLLLVSFAAVIMLFVLVACNTHTHEMEFIERKAPTCGSDGMRQYWQCSICHKMYADESGKEEVTAEDLYLAATGEHNYDYILHKCTVCGAMYPGYTQIGNIVYLDNGENECTVVRYIPENEEKSVEIQLSVGDKTVVGINEKVFINAEISTVVIPDSVTSIGESAFQSSSIENLSLSRGLRELGTHAFAYCKSLAGKVEMPGSIVSFGTGAFNGCISLKEAVIGNGLTELPDFTFTGCTSLTSVKIPVSVTSFGKSVFENCSSLTSVYYDGTIAQWENISKGFWWSYGVNKNCIVYCTDGQIV